MEKRTKGSKTETIVGIFVSFAILFLGIMIWSVGSFRLFEEGRVMTFGFNHVNGLVPNAPVLVSGHHVGEVREIRLHPPRPVPEGALGAKEATYSVTVTAWLPAEVPLYEDVVARISSQGVLGEMYLDLMPGYRGRVLTEKDFIRGRDPVPLAALVESGNEALEGVRTTVETLRSFSERIAGETGMVREVEALVGEARGTLATIRREVTTTGDSVRAEISGVSDVIEENRADIRRATENLRIFSEEMRRIASALDTRIARISARIDATVETASDTLLRTLDEAYAAATVARAGAEEMRANLGAVSRDAKRLVAEGRADLDTATRTLAEAAEAFRRAADEARGLFRDARGGPGALGTLVSDTRTAERIRATVENAEAASEELRLLIEEIRKDPRRFLRFSLF